MSDAFHTRGLDYVQLALSQSSDLRGCVQTLIFDHKEEDSYRDNEFDSNVSIQSRSVIRTIDRAITLTSCSRKEDASAQALLPTKLTHKASVDETCL